MATMRVLAPQAGLEVGKTEEEICRRVLAWLRKPGDVETLVLHAPGAHLRGSDGRDYVIGVDGEPRLIGVAAAEGTTSC